MTLFTVRVFGLHHCHKLRALILAFKLESFPFDVPRLAERAGHLHAFLTLLPPSLNSIQFEFSLHMHNAGANLFSLQWFSLSTLLNTRLPELRSITIWLQDYNSTKSTLDWDHRRIAKWLSGEAEYPTNLSTSLSISISRNQLISAQMYILRR